MANYVTKKEFNELVVAVSGLTEVVNKLLESDKKAPTKKTTPKKSEKKTRSERLDEKYGDIDTRKKYIDTKKLVMAEFSKCYVASNKTLAIPKTKYNKVVTEVTESLVGKKFSAKACKDAFKENAKEIKRA